MLILPFLMGGGLAFAKKGPVNTMPVQSSVSGMVKDAASQQPLLGVSILVKGSNRGTTTDFDGNFTLDNVSPTDVLVVSFMGFETIEIAVEEKTTFEVFMTESANALDEVVVTALGIEKEKKAVGYAVQEVEGDKLTKAREPNITSSLTGRVAGLEVRNNNEFFRSSGISLRGRTPLLVIDGIPSEGTTDYYKLNADDIDEISVLKGATAAALYGSLGKNGAILITTKRGKAGKIEIEINNSTMFQAGFVRIPKVQSTYGNGDNGIYEYVDGSGKGSEGGGWIWGPKLNQPDPSTPSGFYETVQFDSPIDPETGQRIPTPFISRGRDNVENFFGTGMIVSNNIAATGGNEKGNYRVSASHIYQKGIVPNTQLNNATFAVSGGYDITKKLRVDGSLSYNKQYTRNYPSLGYGPTNYLYNLVLWTGTDIDVRDLRNYWVEDQEGIQQRHYNLSYYNNPYFIAYEDLRGYYADNAYGQLRLDYEVVDDLKLTLRSGFNMANTNDDHKTPKSFIGYGSVSRGNYSLSSNNVFNINTDFLASYAKEINEDFSFNVLAGASNRYESSRYLYSSTDGLIIPGFYNLDNSQNPVTSSNDWGENQTNSVFANLDLEVLNSIYLTVTGRNDWVSTLPVQNNSFFYPSVSGSVVVSDLLDWSTDLPYVKLRSSWAKVGSGSYGGRYSHLQTYDTGLTWNNTPSLNFPGTIINPDLKPEFSNSTEYGVDLRFFKNRLGLDVTYYRILDYDQIQQLPISEASGYTSRFVNGDSYLQKGVEVVVNATPIKTDDFRWDVVTNWSQRRSYFEEFYGGENQRGRYKVGDRTDVIYYSPYQHTPEGRLILGNNNGMPLSNPYSDYRGHDGSDWVFGLQNTFSYKNFGLSFSLDGRLGGLMYSSTIEKMWWGGTHPGTVNQFRDDANAGRSTYVVPGVVVVSGEATYDEYGKVLSDDRVYAPNTTPVNYISFMKSTNNALYDHYYDETFLKLRELIITYNFSQELLESIGFKKASISLVGRNLALWSKIDHVDPDSGSDSLQTPTTRNMGVNVSVSF
ncbi:MAG: SusC/RagA family TonB-linked outer membrane protein [Cytophagaceae bacterium]|nr:SusC/RagA family TonB-linked outer membrane protein [Cytophagaceae bacterium]|tara:strand:+ start:10127 stop:13240 length:3114 start_codon:yes stop_codon:yes gene_type:complete